MKFTVYFSTNCIVLVWNKFIETNLDIFVFVDILNELLESC